jgi:DNA-binding CsgD family transcriptional regulator
MLEASAIGDAMAWACASVQSEIRIVAPANVREIPRLADWKHWLPPALDRGVAVYMLAAHKVRSDAATWRVLTEVLSKGVQLRTTCTVGARMTLFDGDIAYVMTPSGVGEVRHSSLVTVLAEVFTEAWDRSISDERQRPRDAVIGETEAAVARLLVAGYLDETIARRLGMSVRACRTHIANLCRRIDAGSRAQLGYEIALSRFLDAPERGNGGG